MTTYLIDNDSYDTTANSTNAFNLGGGDSLILTAGGSLIATGINSIGLNLLSGGTDYATIDGTVYGAYEGIASVGAESSVALFVNGDVYGGQNGILLGAIGDTTSSYNVTIGAAGVVEADFGVGIFLIGASADVTVNGQVDSTVDGITDYATSSQIVIGATGVVTGNVGIYGGTSLTINGAVEGQYDGLLSAAGAVVNIGTTGAVSGGSSAGIEASGNATISNAGLVEGATGILVDGGVSVALSNTGTILDGVNFSAGSYDSITNTHGTISGAVTLGQYDTLINSDGAIGNGVVLAYGDTVTNNGTIASGIQGGGGASIQNAGTITGGIADSNAATDTIDNMGRILGTINEHAASLTNSGTMHGEIYFATQSTLDNSGTITGKVIFAGSDDTVTNSGTIHGLVTLGTGDSFTNSGAIHGGLDLGAGDTLDTSTGSVTGHIVASASNTFDFSGSFGKYEIAGFVPVAGHATSYDVMDFASDDFTSYTELQSHMAQVGKDVVITLDAADDIVLMGVKLTNLNAHDFLFT